MTQPANHTTELQQTFKVEGMTCGSCVARVENLAAKIPGVHQANVNLATETLTLTTTAEFDATQLSTALDKAGYGLPATTIQLDIEGMTCASCVGRVEKALLKLPNVASATVNLANEQAIISTYSPQSNIDDIIAAVKSAGYVAHIRTSASDNDYEQRKSAEATELKRDVIISAALTLPIFVLEMTGHFYMPFHHWLYSIIPASSLNIFYFALTTLVILFPGRRFFTTGFKTLKNLAPDMNALVMLGAGAAYIYSTLVLISPQIFPPEGRNIYFEAASVIITLILLGRFMEARAKNQAGQAISKLAALQVKSAKVLVDGHEVERAIEDVNIGDLLIVYPGDQIPLDGEVISGSAYVDEAMISGEPVPVQKSVGDNVIGGTINQNGNLTMRVTKVGADTMLSQIVKLVEQAQGSKLPIQKKVDQITLWFVPAIILVALATFFIWLALGNISYALMNAVAVLIIACPCAMGLAVPTSIMVGSGRAAKFGILFKNGEALQTLGEVKAVAFDKTGTLTQGHPSVTHFVTSNAQTLNADAILAQIASVEAMSEHPTANAIVSYAEDKNLNLTKASMFQAHAGNGVSATIDDHLIRIGSADFLTQNGIDISEFKAQADMLSAQGNSPVFAAIDETAVAFICVADELKPSSAKTIEALHALGIKTAMVTGDNKNTASAIAARLGIDTLKAQTLPHQKVEVVENLIETYGSIAFVGDGINDAPALAKANVGIAMGTGTDVAIESGDVVLVQGNPTSVVEAISLSRAVMANIKQNLVWAFGYNILLVPIAAGILYPFTGILLSPMLGAVAMALSSTCVVLNALRLNLKSPYFKPEAS